MDSTFTLERSASSSTIEHCQLVATASSSDIGSTSGWRQAANLLQACSCQLTPHSCCPSMLCHSTDYARFFTPEQQATRAGSDPGCTKPAGSRATLRDPPQGWGDSKGRFAGFVTATSSAAITCQKEATDDLGISSKIADLAAS